MGHVTGAFFIPKIKMRDRENICQFVEIEPRSFLEGHGFIFCSSGCPSLARKKNQTHGFTPGLNKTNRFSGDGTLPENKDHLCSASLLEDKCFCFSFATTWRNASLKSRVDWNVSVQRGWWEEEQCQPCMRAGQTHRVTNKHARPHLLTPHKTDTHQECYSFISAEAAGTVPSWLERLTAAQQEGPIGSIYQWAYWG